MTAVPNYVVDPAYCPLTYWKTISPTPNDANAITFDHPSRVFTISTSDRTSAGVYSVTLLHSMDSLGTVATDSFDVTILDPCPTATLTIDNTILSALALTYKITLSPLTETWTDAKVTSSETDAACPAYVYSLANQDGTAYDSALITFSATGLSVSSSDLVDAGVHNLRLSV